MRVFKVFLCYVFVILLIFCSGICVAATNFSSEYDLIELSESETETIRKGFGEITSVTTAPEGHNFECYAIKDNGVYAIGFIQKTVSNVGKCTICIYENGVFLSGFSFTHCNYLMNWNGDNIVVFEGSNHVLIEFSPTGEIVHIMRFPITIKNQDAIYHAKQMKKNCGNNIYIAKKQFFLDAGYATLIKSSTNGDKEILYHANFGDLRETGWIYIFLLVAALLCVPGLIFVIILFKKLKKVKPKEV